MSRFALEKTDRVGEAFALQVLSEHFGAEIFIGASVELKVEELASVVYKQMQDPAFYGATVTIERDNRKYVVLNTDQALRLRYFTAAHELWHVLDIHSMVKDDIDQERAADRFAAALMLPESLVRSIGRSIQGDQEDVKRVVIRLADISSAPYVAVAKRLVELNLTKNQSLSDYSEEAWLTIRKELNIVESPLDRPLAINQFSDYEKRLERQVENGAINHLDLSKKLAQLSPLKAAEHAERYTIGIKHMQDEEDETDDLLDELYEQEKNKNDGS